jgi:CrcB protein
MLQTLLAGLGGFVGSILRYLLVNLVYNLMDYPVFPYGTLLVNIIGCFVIGFLSGLAETREAFTPELRIFLFIGILGGFTTFSSFGYDTFGLLRDGAFIHAILNVLAQVIIGLGAVWLGYTLSRLIWGA